MFAKSVAFVDKPLYHYVKTNGNSITSFEQIKYDFCRVESIKFFEKTIIATGNMASYKNEVLWVKYHIKDHFLSSAVSKERIDAWYTSFPEVDAEWRKVKDNRFLHFVMIHHLSWLLYIPYWYKVLRFNMHKWLKKIINI